jgi:hypothetical protein
MQQILSVRRGPESFAGSMPQFGQIMQPWRRHCGEKE